MTENIEQEQSAKKKRNGFGFRLATAILLFIAALAFSAMPLIIDYDFRSYHALTSFYDYCLYCRSENPGDSATYFPEVAETYESSCVYTLENQDGNLVAVATHRCTVAECEGNGQRRTFAYVDTDTHYLEFDDYTIDFYELTGKLSYDAFSESGTEEDYVSYLLTCDLTSFELRETNRSSDWYGQYSLSAENNQIVLEIIWESDCYFYGDTFRTQRTTGKIPYSETVFENGEDAYFIFQSDDGTEYRIDVSHEYSEYLSSLTVASVGLGLSAGFFLLASFSVFLAIAGKKHKWANVVCIVLNAVLCLGGAVFGIFLTIWGIIGGEMGIKSLGTPKPQALPDQPITAPDQPIAAENEGAAESMPTDETADGAVFETKELNYIQPKMGPKGKKRIMIGLIVSYALLMIFGILLVAVPQIAPMFSAIGICESTAARAYSVTIGMMWLALIPAFGFYFATISPLELGKKQRIIIAGISALLLIVMNAVFFTVICVAQTGGNSIRSYYENSDGWFIPLSMVFASLGTAICYALTLFKIEPDKIKTVKPEKPEDSGIQLIIRLIKYVLSVLVGAVLSLIKKLLTFKEKQPDIFIVAATALLTWLVYFAAFIFAVICLAVMILVIVLYFTSVVSLGMYDVSHYSKQVRINVDGAPVTLTEQDWVEGDRMEKVYTDALGNRYYSDDGGKTAYQGKYDHKDEDDETT